MNIHTYSTKKVAKMTAKCVWESKYGVSGACGETRTINLTNAFVCCLIVKRRVRKVGWLFESTSLALQPPFIRSFTSPTPQESIFSPAYNTLQEENC